MAVDIEKADGMLSTLIDMKIEIMAAQERGEEWADDADAQSAFADLAHAETRLGNSINRYKSTLLKTGAK
jgi:hypothetical protein